MVTREHQNCGCVMRCATKSLQQAQHLKACSLPARYQQVQARQPYRFIGLQALGRSEADQPGLPLLRWCRHLKLDEPVSEAAWVQGTSHAGLVVGQMCPGYCARRSSLGLASALASCTSHVTLVDTYLNRMSAQMETCSGGRYSLMYATTCTGTRASGCDMAAPEA